tara:strand:- start:71101 stop:71484 length:384 start_codon:yes stop_codon:yes gene_type:complete
MRFALIILIFTFNAFAQQNYRWSDLVEGETYRIDRDIEMDYAKNLYKVSKGQLLKLQNVKPLPMINVYMAEFHVTKCTDTNMTTEMILVEVKQPDSKVVSVGVDLTYGCKLEVFIEKKDYSSKSILY